MEKVLTNYNVKMLLKYMRNKSKLKQSELGNLIGESKDWVSVKEREKERIYIKDFIKIMKILKFKITLKSTESGTTISMNDYDTFDIIRFLREGAEKSQTDFAKSIGKSRGWQASNESGITSYYANDFFKLALIHNYILIINKNLYKIK